MKFDHAYNLMLQIEAKEHSQMAQEAYSFLQNACNNLAYDIVEIYKKNPQDITAYGTNLINLIKQGKNAGVQDLAEWLTDQFWNNADYIYGFLSNWLSSKISQTGDRNLVLDDLVSMSSSKGIQEAIMRLRR